MNSKIKVLGVLSLALSLAMVPSTKGATKVEAATVDYDRVVYLKPSTNWMEGNARFAVYSFIGGDNSWYSMRPLGDSGYYWGEANSASTLIMCRMNPNTSLNNWEKENMWNQSENLTNDYFLGGGNNTYRPKEGAWNNDGYWEVYHAYNLVFNVDGGSEVTSANVIDPMHNNVDLSSYVTEKDGYSFKGWSLTEGGEVISSYVSDKVVTGDVNLYAVYEATSEYTVTWKVNNEIVSQATTVNHVLEKTAPTSEEVAAKGYTVHAWGVLPDTLTGNITINATKYFKNFDTKTSLNLTYTYDNKTTAETVYFAHTRLSGQPYVLASKEGGSTYSQGSSIPMTWAFDDVYGKAVFKVDIPSEYTKLTFHIVNNNEESDRLTVDRDNNLFYYGEDGSIVSTYLATDTTQFNIREMSKVDLRFGSGDAMPATNFVGVETYGVELTNASGSSKDILWTAQEAEVEGNVQFAAVINDIPQTAYTLTFTAKCFVVIEGVRYYVTERSASVKSLAEEYVNAVNANLNGHQKAACRYLAGF